MKDRIGIALFLVIAFVLLAVAPSSDKAQFLDPKKHTGTTYPLRINEVVADNASLLTDRDGDHSDWIELFNAGKEAINLEGYGLSDDPSIPHKWTFPNHVLEPGEYLLVFASRKESTPEELHANFRLNRNGDKLSLADPGGVLLITLLLAETVPDMAYGVNELGEYVYWLRGTPGLPNQGTQIENVKAYRKGCDIDFSHTPGFYKEGFDLTLTASREDVVMRYTLDGKTPGLDAALYHSPLRIDHRDSERYRYAAKQVTFSPPFVPEQRNVFKGTVVTVQAYQGRTPIGKPFISTYFVDPAGVERYTLPVVSLVTDPENLFDDKSGIFAVGSAFRKTAPETPDGATPANYNQRGREWERDVHLEWFQENGIFSFSQNLGMRTFGGWSRAEVKKSVKLFARTAYDPDHREMKYSFFPELTGVEGEPIDTYRRLILRNGGNDWNTTLFRDPLMQGLADDIQDKQASRPVIVFLNGEYWGIYYLTESLDAEWVASHYGVDPQEVAIVSNGWELYEGVETDLADYQEMMDYAAEHDMSDDTHFARLQEMLDTEAYLRYQAAQIYFGNLDWPGNNLKMWRIRGREEATESDPDAYDGKWRPMLYDTDFGFGLYEHVSDYTHDTLALALDPQSEEWPNPPWSTLLFRKLMENESCREQFVEIMTKALDTRYAEKTVVEQILWHQKQLEPEMAEYAARYPLWRIPSVAHWRDEGIQNLKTYAAKRPEYMRMYLHRHFQSR